MRSMLLRLGRDRGGAAALEFALIVGLVLSASLGAVEFSYLFFQWNSASKAVQLGARLAAVSDPVSSELKTYTGLDFGADPGDPMPYFKRVCDGHSESCSGTGSGSGNYDAAAMNTIVYGRGGNVCGDAQAGEFPGMCDVFPRISPENVVVTYVQTGLGFAGRPGGPVPTIVVELQRLKFEFVLVDKLFGFNSIDLPPFRTSITGEDLSTGAS